MEQLLTIKDVSNICKVTPGTVRNWVYQKKIPHVKLGGKNGRVRFYRKQVDDFIKRYLVNSLEV